MLKRFAAVVVVFFVGVALFLNQYGQELMPQGPLSLCQPDKPSCNVRYNRNFCTMESCFDYSKCWGGPFKVYFQPNTQDQIKCESEVWQDFKKFLLHQPWRTQNLSEACLVVPDLSTDSQNNNLCVDDLTQAVTQVSTWSWSPVGPGSNHVLMSIHDSPLTPLLQIMKIPFGTKFLWMTTGFHSAEIRTFMDTVLPLAPPAYGSGFLTFRTVIVNQSAEQIQARPFLLTFKGTRYNSNEFIRNTIKRNADRRSVGALIYTRCHIRTMDANCTQDDEEYDNSPDMKELLMQSTFGLAPRGYGLHSYRFMETLLSGAIPAVLADGLVLPFTPEVDWSKCVVRIPERLAASVTDILMQISKEERLERHLRCRELTKQLLWVGNEKSEVSDEYPYTWRLYKTAFHFLEKRIYGNFK